MKRVILLGSTGSIGASTLDVVRGLPGAFRIAGLAAHRNGAELCRQALEFDAPAIAIADPDALPPGAGGFRGAVHRGPDAAAELVRSVEADVIVAAMAGAAGLAPVLAALETGKDVALANKETLVMAGSVVTALADRLGRRIVPIDSEHSAIFQCLQGAPPERIETLILTASGGALRDVAPERRHDVTPEQALRHPNWRMGPKVTIDSASLMNKALEIIEAHWLFRVPPSKIKVLIHPESIVHSMVQFCDGSVLAQLGPPDMRYPIQYALTHPARMPSGFPRLDLAAVGCLRFTEPRGYKALDLAYRVLREGGTAGAVFNAANEVAVEEFLARRIKFTAITDIVEETLRRRPPSAGDGLEALMAHDRWARATAHELARA
ncbi:MAG TPA: 1-deoxy-D-xylulose-5-phosphate reductoisomerase [Planctomycetes bacterium]|nr:1-deoxy-D-xylulose-5-phosphate reductoisomerase [Planctomycetota bacterium]